MTQESAGASRIPREMYPDMIGSRLRTIRVAFGLKPSQIADRLGINRSVWSRLEAGKRPPPDEVAYLVCDHFQVTLDYLILGRWGGLSLEVADKLRAAEAKIASSSGSPDL